MASVLDGRRPGTGRPLVTRRGAVAGYDLTFAAPKSVSVLMALGTGPEAVAVLDAHGRACSAALDYVARRALTARRGSEESRSLIAVDGMVGAMFTHGFSRALDPHLHSHVVVANIGHGADGRWSGVDGRGIYAHARAAGALYDAELRRALGTRLGVRWRRSPSGAFEIDGVDPLLLGAFSSRRAEIRHAVAAAGRLADPAGGPVRSGRRVVLSDSGAERPLSRRVARVAWASTRDPKDPQATPAHVVARWQDRARDLVAGVDGLPLESGRDAGGRDGRCRVDEHRFAGLLDTSPHAAACRRDVVAAWAASLPGGSTAADVERCVDLLVAWGPSSGVGEQRRPLVGLVPAPHHLRAVGARPGIPEQLGVWLGAVATIDEYRVRWRVTDRGEPLGVDGSAGSLASLPARRLADHLAASRVLDGSRRRLGLERGRDVERRSASLGIG
jgi:conjugative relaxase-like TrwC/TraI family protein